MGWINIAGHWLRTRMLVPAQKHAFATGRVCHLIFPHRRPIRRTVTDIATWIIKQTEADMHAIDQIYPALGIARLLRA
ncbi:MAG: hypothetical protein EPN31_06280 [Castellaniella sp.]|uniref:hypothetical protein n=1 Tax=Castellaniella sp. TaxID=1955812 RepID=UPI00121F4D72|nr:hypothetical protein [Castellaniella sp.]TAN29537.1 MAG: hypothetical protein EPN31_06280 [Castellaniella sp.]